jgi:hypothetical protein
LQRVPTHVVAVNSFGRVVTSVAYRIKLTRWQHLNLGDGVQRTQLPSAALRTLPFVFFGAESDVTLSGSSIRSINSSFWR